jgi:peptidoglycan/xylan/chitin deacetylase (PgdA/CDA1 family)
MYLPVLVGACAAYLGGPWAVKILARRRLAALCRHRRAVVLTYDDGPCDSLTPALLDCLRAHGVHATFFAIGRRAAAMPELLDRILDEGHEIGCHSYDHVHPWKCLPWRSLGDMNRGYRALAPWVPGNGLFRPPYGKLTPFTLLASRARGARLGWWTIDARDCDACLPADRGRSAQALLEAGGGVVLMHDWHRSPERIDYVLETTARVLRAAREQALSVCTMRQLLGLPAVAPPVAGRRTTVPVR